MGQNEIYTSISSSVSNAWNAIHSSTKSLSSGQRINSAGDDAAGLAVAESLRGDVASARQGSHNAGAAISMLQTADAAAQKIGDNLIRMKELATQASSGTLSDSQKAIIQNEFDQLAAENTRIADTTEFNGKKLFTEGQTAVSLDGDVVQIQTQAISEAAADLVNNAADAAKTVDSAISQLSELRSSFGSMINQIETAVETLDNKTETIMAAQSRIADADMASQVAALTAAGVQTQVAIATQAHANKLGDIIASLVCG
jgi:flagellin